MLGVLLAIGGIPAHICPAVPSRGDVEHAAALLARIEQSRARIASFSCTVENTYHGIASESLNQEDGALDGAQVKSFAFDSMGRGRVCLFRPAREDIFVWDGTKSIEYRRDQLLNGPTVAIRDSQHPQTYLRNRPPWTLLGDKFCGFLRRAMQTDSNVEVRKVNTDLYRIEATYRNGGGGVAVVDPDKGHAILSQQYYISGEICHAYNTRFQRIDEDLWFPVEGTHSRFYPTDHGRRENRTTTRITDIRVNDPNFESLLAIPLVRGTEVRDYTANRHYIVGSKSVYDLETPDATKLRPADPSWRPAFNAAHRLGPGEVLRRIAPPFASERRHYIDNMADKLAGFEELTFVWSWDGALEPRMVWGARFVPLHAIIQNMLGLDSRQFDQSASLMQMRIGGDWIIRTDASQDALFEALEREICEETSRKVEFIKRPSQHHVIVARGPWRRESGDGEKAIRIALNVMDNAVKEESGTPGEFLSCVGGLTHMHVIDQTEGSPQVLKWITYDSAAPDSQSVDPNKPSDFAQTLLAGIARQTNLVFTIETRQFERWSVIEAGIRKQPPSLSPPQAP